LRLRPFNFHFEGHNSKVYKILVRTYSNFGYSAFLVTTPRTWRIYSFIHSWQGWGRGQNLWGRGRGHKIWPRGHIGLENL